MSASLKVPFLFLKSTVRKDQRQDRILILRRILGAPDAARRVPDPRFQRTCHSPMSIELWPFLSAP